MSYIVRDASLGLIAFLKSVLNTSVHAETPLLYATIAPKERPAQIIELGSGCGIVGIAYGQMLPRCNVLLTDLPEAMDTLELNRVQARCPTETTLEQCILNWDNPLPAEARKHYDLILISDCTYNSDSSPALVRTLKSLLMESPQALVLVSMKMRHASELIFFELMREVGLVEEEQTKILLPDQWREQCGLELEQIEVYLFRMLPNQIVE